MKVVLLAFAVVTVSYAVPHFEGLEGSPTSSENDTDRSNRLEGSKFQFSKAEGTILDKLLTCNFKRRLLHRDSGNSKEDYVPKRRENLSLRKASRTVPVQMEMHRQ